MSFFVDYQKERTPFDIITTKNVINGEVYVPSAEDRKLIISDFGKYIEEADTRIVHFLL